MTLQISPNLNHINLDKLFDSAQNDKLVEIPNGSLIDLGVTAPLNFSLRFKSTLDRVLFIDIGSGDRFYEIPLSFFANLTWNLGEHLYRIDTAPTEVERFILVLNGNDAAR